MSTVQDFYAAKRDAATTIDKPVVHITSINKPYEGKTGGVTVIAKRDLAAHMIALGSHRLSTSEEASAHDKAEKQAVEDSENCRVLPMTPATIAMVARAANEPKNKKGDNS